ncbi:putative cytochrome-c peroxidase [Catenovulum agarivorans DS-2]|uniref:Putative cytochrome-c peroxidase n=1 Tax=Catenovulum agarivorans DS-2 TaxID=1328313 RepID=W7QG36_9ALTE|nr:FG-GAP-like repeat-containing protein [Catenovulum agarivorans]EWH11894.1 putative cytochrome-c peroxidase [Catenovulum agarivorans DS-2]
MRYLYFVLFLPIVVACGGGSNSDATNVNTDTPTHEQPQTEQTIDDEIANLAALATFDANTVKPQHNLAAQGAIFELGKALFFSTDLSMQDDVACVSCHHPQLGGGDALSLPVGVDALDIKVIGPGRTHDGERVKDPLADGGPNVPRNAQTTFNLHVYTEHMFWDGRIERLTNGIKTPDSVAKQTDPSVGDDLVEAQARFPIVSTNEMFGHGSDAGKSNTEKRQLLVEKLKQKQAWLDLFTAAFADGSDENAADLLTVDNIAKALAHYQKSQVFINAPWFDYLAGDTSAISESAKKGALLFYKPLGQGGYGCNVCHSGAGFTDNQFHNIAVPQIGRGKNTAAFDTGRALVTSLQQDKYSFRTPSLLNIEVTAPYGHSGAYLTLAQMVKHHVGVESALVEFDYSLTDNPQFAHLPVDAQRNQERSSRAFEIWQTSEDRDLLATSVFGQNNINDLVAFLTTLTDPCTKDAACLQPWVETGSNSAEALAILPAQFATFDEQISTWQPATNNGGQQGQVVDETTAFTHVSSLTGFDYNLAAAEFTDEMHTIAGGVSVADIDQDGWLDIFVSHGNQPGKLFRNNQGVYQEITSTQLSSLKGIQFSSIFIDLNADTWPDLIVLNDDISMGYLQVFINQAGNGFVEDSSKKGLSFSRFSHSIAAGDYDADGDLDLYVTHWNTGRIKPVSRENLWRNDNGVFTDVSHLLPAPRSSQLYGDIDMQFTPAFYDYDQDGLLDILIAADFGTSQVLKNTGDAGFIDATPASITDENGMGSALGDYDNDGDLDWFVSSIWNPSEHKAYDGGESGNRLYRNDNGTWVDTTDKAGVRFGYWGWGACFADFNQDGWEDIFHTNGMTDGRIASESEVSQFFTDPSLLYINQQNGTFTEESVEWGISHTGQGRGISCFDFDNDGDQDILIAHNGKAPQLYRNNNQGNYLTVQLKQSGTNRNAIGAKVTVVTDVGSQTKWLTLNSNYMSNNPTLVYFGLGQAQGITRVEIVWPDGSTTSKQQVSLNQVIVITKP